MGCALPVRFIRTIGVGILILYVLAISAKVATSQGTTYSAGQVFTVSASAVPATCTVGAVYIRTSTSISLNFCSATNTWTTFWPYDSGSGTTTVGGGFTVSGIQSCTTATCTLSLSTPVVYCDATSNSVTLQLPDSQAGATFYSIQRIDNTAANTCTLDGDSSDTINNQTTYLIAPDVSYSLVGKTTSAWRISSSFLPTVPAETNLGTVGTTETVDFANNLRGQYILTLDENLTLTFSNPAYGASYTLILTQDSSGTNTVTWPASVLWADGSAPTITATANKTSLCVLTYTNGAGAGTNKYLAACNLNY